MIKKNMNHMQCMLQQRIRIARANKGIINIHFTKYWTNHIEEALNIQRQCMEFLIARAIQFQDLLKEMLVLWDNLEQDGNLLTKEVCLQFHQWETQIVKLEI